MSMSRIAIHERPNLPRTRFLAISAKTTHKVSAKMYLVSGVARGLVTSGLRKLSASSSPPGSMKVPNKVRGGDSIVPFEL